MTVTTNHTHLGETMAVSN